MAGLLLLLLAMIDYLHGRLPFVLTILFASLGIMLTVVNNLALEPGGWYFVSVLGYQVLVAGAVWSLLSLINGIYRRIRKTDGLGGGDTALIAASAFWLAPQDTPASAI